MSNQKDKNKIIDRQYVISSINNSICNAKIE